MVAWLTGSAPQDAAVACVTTAVRLNSMWHASQEESTVAGSAAAFTTELAQFHLNLFCEDYQLIEHFYTKVIYPDWQVSVML